MDGAEGQSQGTNKEEKSIALLPAEAESENRVGHIEKKFSANVPLGGENSPQIHPRGHIQQESPCDVPFFEKSGTWGRSFLRICPQRQFFMTKKSKMGHRERIFTPYVPENIRYIK